MYKQLKSFDGNHIIFIRLALKQRILVETALFCEISYKKPFKMCLSYFYLLKTKYKYLNILVLNLLNPLKGRWFPWTKIKYPKFMARLNWQRGCEGWLYTYLGPGFHKQKTKHIRLQLPHNWACKLPEWFAYENTHLAFALQITWPRCCQLWKSLPIH